MYSRGRSRLPRPGQRFHPPDHPHDWTLLIGDETSLPAIAGICSSLHEEILGHAIIDIPTSADRQEFSAPPGMKIEWIVRDESQDAHERPGTLALRALTQMTFPEGEVHVHAIGESTLVMGARRHLTQDRGIPKRREDFVGYWRSGLAQTS